MGLAGRALRALQGDGTIDLDAGSRIHHRARTGDAIAFGQRFAIDVRGHGARDSVRLKARRRRHLGIYQAVSEQPDIFMLKLIMGGRQVVFAQPCPCSACLQHAITCMAVLEYSAASRASRT